MLSTGVIEPSHSPWASPVCMVRKKEGTYRFCVDYRKVNSVSKKDAFPVPDIHDALDHLRGAKYFATFDLLSGYWQLGLTERAKERSAFCTKRGLFQFTRMPFGLAGAPSSFCRLMSIVLKDLLWEICLCYLDDIVIFARTQEELLERLRIVLNRLRQVGLKVKPSKCALFKEHIKFLGHVVSQHGIEPQQDKIEAIRNWPRPQCIRDVRAFYGLASYYRRFVKGFASIAEPLTRLTQKNVRFEWTEEAQTAFTKLKKALEDATTLAFPHPNIPCIVDSDASDVAIGAILSQVIDGVERPIAFYSKVMSTTQRNYCPTRRELLAVIAALQHFRHYLLGNHVTLRTDHHSLRWLNTFKRPEGILARWIETLAEFDYHIEHRPGRLHCNADGVSRPACKQCVGKIAKTPWVDELERADELTEPLGLRRITWAPEITNNDLSTMQAEDETISVVLEWLQSNHEPSSDELRLHPLEIRTLWALRSELQLRENVLIRVLGNKVQLIVPFNLRRGLFDNVHAGPLSAHLGSDRTLSQLKQEYYWPGMRRDIITWYRQCTQCARGRGPPNRPHGALQKVTVGEPLDIVAVDILSGLPTTPEGYQYILVITDYFTKWSEAYPLKDAEAPTCMRAMYNSFFARFGLPRQLHSDQGKNFESKLFHELCALAGVAKTKTTPFHPQSDGQTERMNRTLLQMLRATCQESPENWPKKLDSVMSAYRMTTHSVTGVTPNLAMLGREVILPATLIVKPPDEPLEVTVPFVADLRNHIREAHAKIRRATQAVAKTQKVYYDRRSRGLKFALDQLVWLFWPSPPRRQRYRKLQQVWTGPWKIVAFKSNVVVELQKQTGRQIRYTTHIDRLSPYRGTVPIQNSPTFNVPLPQEGSPSSPQNSAEPEHQASTSLPIPPTAPISVSTRPQRSRRMPVALEPYVVEL